jgi:hypothetical protein
VTLTLNYVDWSSSPRNLSQHHVAATKYNNAQLLRQAVAFTTAPRHCTTGDTHVASLRTQRPAELVSGTRRTVIDSHFLVLTQSLVVLGNSQLPQWPS